MSEAFVNTLRRDYLAGADLSTAATVLEQIPAWIADYNAVAPHSALGYQSPHTTSSQSGQPPSPAYSAGQASRVRTGVGRHPIRLEVTLGDGVRLHDLRHTFGVHCARAGVPLARIQKLMGHASLAMTLRYLQHAPESFFDEDGARVADSLSGASDAEAQATAELLRSGIRPA